MGTITLPHTSKADSDSNLFSDVHDNDDAIITVVNGSLDSDNLASGAVGTTALANDAVTNDKLGLSVENHPATSNLTVGLTFQVIPGLSFSADAGTYLVWVVVDLILSGSALAHVAQLEVSGVNQGQAILWRAQGGGARGSGTRSGHWVITTSAGQTVRVTAGSLAGSSGETIESNNTHMMALRIA